MEQSLRTLTATEVGALLSYAADTVRRQWRRWHAESGFPPPLVGNKWDAEAIEAWRNRKIEAIEMEAPPPGRSRRHDPPDDASRQRAAQRTADRLAKRRQPPS